MIKPDSIKKNFIYQSSYQLLSIVLPLITTPYISRVLLPEGVGIYSYTNSIMYFFLIAANLGISNYGNRTIAENIDNREKVSRSFFSLFICHACITFLCIVIYGVYWGVFCKDYKSSFLCQGVQLLATFFDITWFFSGIQKFKVTVLRNFIIRLFSVVLIFTIVKTQDDIWKYILILAGGNLVGQIVVWTQLKEYITFVRVSVKEVVSHLRPLVILFIPIMAIGVYRYMDKIMIPKFSTYKQLGLYENSEKIMSIPLSFINTFGVVLLPKMSVLAKEGQTTKSREYIEIAMRYEMCLAIGMMFGLIGIAPVFSTVFLGSDFSECSVLIATIAVTIVFLTWSNSIRAQYLIPNKKDKSFVIATFAGALINLIMNLFYIPRYGAMGAVIGTIMAEFVVAFVQTLYAKNDLRIGRMLVSAIFFILPGMFMSVLVRIIGEVMGQRVGTIILQLSVGATVYVVISLSYFYRIKDPLLRSVINKFRVKRGI